MQTQCYSSCYFSSISVYYLIDSVGADTLSEDSPQSVTSYSLSSAIIATDTATVPSISAPGSSNDAPRSHVPPAVYLVVITLVIVGVILALVSGLRKRRKAPNKREQKMHRDGDLCCSYCDRGSPNCGNGGCSGCDCHGDCPGF